jgi:alpha-tubulin suppressor-like RCC1 family protein
MGSAFTVARKTDGTLWSWGQNGSGQLGINIGNYDRSSPVQVGALTNWSKISAGTAHCLAVKTDGTLWAWGKNSNGELGINNTYYRSSPVQVGSLTDWLQVSGGNTHSLAVKTNGTLWAWGNGSQGMLGLNNTIDRSSPVQVGVLTNWVNVSAGNSNSAAIKADGTLWTWGENGDGQLGQNNLTYRSSPVQVGALTAWRLLGRRPSAKLILALKTTKQDNHEQKPTLSFRRTAIRLNCAGGYPESKPNDACVNNLCSGRSSGRSGYGVAS